MAISVDELIREIRKFDTGREIVKALGKALRAGVPPLRKEIRDAAIETLPEKGGLGRWVSEIRINFQVKTGSSSASVKLIGGRNSAGGRSDVDAIDRGRVRAPSWGRRHKGDWHTQAVPEGFFTATAAESTAWNNHVDAEVDQALDQLRR